VACCLLLPVGLAGTEKKEETADEYEFISHISCPLRGCADASEIVPRQSQIMSGDFVSQWGIFTVWFPFIAPEKIGYYAWSALIESLGRGRVAIVILFPPGRGKDLLGSQRMPLMSIFPGITPALKGDEMNPHPEINQNTSSLALSDRGYKFITNGCESGTLTDGFFSA